MERDRRGVSARGDRDPAGQRHRLRRAGRHRRPLPGPRPRLRRTRRGRRPAGPAPRRPRRGPRHTRRRLPGALARAADQPAGRPAHRGRLRADRPGLPAGPDRPHAPGLRRPTGRDRRDAGRDPGGVPDHAGTGFHRARGRAAGGPPRPLRPGHPRLRDLHLRLHRPAQGRPGRPPGAGELPVDDGPQARLRLRGLAARADHRVFRHRRPGAVPATGAGRHRGDPPRRRGRRRRRPARACGTLRAHRPAGHTDHLADAARRRLERRSCAAGAVRRRTAARRTGRAARAPRRRPLQHVRPDRDHHLVHRGPGAARRGAHHRQACRQHPLPRPRRAWCPGSARHPRRVAPVRGRGRRRLPRPVRPDRRTVRHRPRRHRPRLPYRGPGTPPARRPPGVPGADRRPGQAQRLPDRTRRGGVRPAPAAGCHRRRRRRPRGPAR